MARILKRRAAMASQTSFADTVAPTVPQNPTATYGTGSQTFTIQDDGNRADGDAGVNWTDTTATANGRLVIASQKFKSGGSSYREMKYVASSPASADYSVEITNRNDGTGARAYQIWARYTGSGATKCGYRAEIDKNGGTYRLLVVTNDVDTQLIAATAWTIQDDDRIGIRVTGTTIAIIRNGTVVASATDSTYSAAGTFAVGVYNPNNDLTFDDITCTATVTGVQRVVVTADASTDAVGVTGYKLERQTDSGSWVTMNANSPITYLEDTSVYTGHTFNYRWSAFDAAGNYSGVSATASVTLSSGPTADVTAPTTPGVARLESGAGDDLSAVISWAICNDVDPGSGAAVSGTKEYDVYDVDAAAVLAVVPHPRVGAFTTSNSIGAESPVGSDSAGVLTGGGAEHWGVLDAYFMTRYQVDGDYDAFVTVTAVAGRDGNYYGKGMLEERTSTDPAATYYGVLHFPSAGANTVKAEYRTATGGQAAGSSEFSIALPVRFWLASRYKTKKVYYSTVTTVGSESWTELDSRYMDVTLSRLVGIAASNASMTYANFAVSAANRVFYEFAGVASSTKRIKIRARDFAGNQTSLGAQLDVVFNAPSGGGGGGGGGGSGANHDYPRNSGYVTGGGTGGDQTYASSTDRDRIARFCDVAIFGGPQPGFYAGAAQTRQQTYSDIAARAIGFGRNLYKYQYVNYNEIDFNRAGSMMGPAWWDAVDGSNWWGYVSGTSGTKSQSTWAANLGLVNMSHFSPTRGGLYPYQWAGYHAAQKFLYGIDGAYDAAPALEGFFLDNGFWYVKSTNGMDMGRGGGSATLDDWWTGHADFITACQLYTGRRAGYNSSDLFSGSFVTYPRTQLLNLLQIGCMEGYLTGAGNLATCVPEINTFVGRHTSDAHVVVQHLGLNADGSDAYDATAFRANRYHKCMLLMTNAYYQDSWNLNHWADANALKMFDEVDGGALATPNFLGAAVGAVQNAPWSGSVWRREFQYGWVFATDSAATVSLTGLHRLTSTRGDPINNGASGGSVNLGNRDGIIVLK